MRERHWLVPKNESFSSYLKGLKLSKCSDIWTINTTHNTFLAHQLRMRFHLLSFLAQAIFNAAKKRDSLYGACRESQKWRGSSENGADPTKMARIQRKWRGSNENGAGNKFRGASKKFRGADNKFRDQFPGTYIQDGGYFG